ncbi:hypothetical protein [Pseudalkalibacillus berkeleyi]|uniref:hypothetical protein n=1 Tax=Pseudalkalibacillus berkeleyi TaxID=1069813 RepID=UPI002E352CAD|nr:hypothetical protein [Pseudalkalibacillus berkeleyi]
MITIQKATATHVEGIVKVCTEGNRATYKDIYTQEYLDRITEEFYNPERVLSEVSTSTRDWGGYFVALER